MSNCCEIIKINPDFPEKEVIKKAADILSRGDLVVFPTETVYGIGAIYGNTDAELKLYTAKNRNNTKPFSVHISNKDIVEKLNCLVDNRAKKLMDKYWPGPLTLILPLKLKNEKIGFRFPCHKVALDLIEAVGGAVVASSANKHTSASPITALQAYNELNADVCVVLDSGTTGYGKDSTIVDLSDTNEVIVLREGAVTKTEIFTILNEVF